MANEDTFRDVFRSTYSRLHRYARNRGLTGADADDLVAATFEIAWRRLEDVPLDDPAPWLFAVARNLWRNKRRSDQRARSLLERLGAGVVHVDPVESETHPNATALSAALGRLGDDDRELLILIAWDGLTPTQAAAVLGCSPVAVRTRLHRARRRLAGLLDRGRTLQRNVFSEQVGLVPTALTTEVSDG